MATKKRNTPVSPRKKKPAVPQDPDIQYTRLSAAVDKLAAIADLLKQTEVVPTYRAVTPLLSMIADEFVDSGCTAEGMRQPVSRLEAFLSLLEDADTRVLQTIKEQKYSKIIKLLRPILDEFFDVLHPEEARS
jgi:hypothetical protein